MNRFKIQLLMASLAAAAAVASAGAEASPEGPPDEPSSCANLEAGPPGPSGNQLLLVGNRHGTLRRVGDEIVFTELRSADEVPCVGPPATVHSIDRIVYRGSAYGRILEIDQSGGTFGPGATPERGGDEIEIEVEFPEVIPERVKDSLWAVAGEGGRVRIGALGGGRIGLDLEPGPGDPRPDADVFVRSQSPAYFRLIGSDGPDLLDGSGSGRAFSGPLPLKGMEFSGGDGDDVLLGGSHRDILRGGYGEDVIRGGRGSDRVTGDDDSDRLYGGTGRDQMDAHDLSRDVVVCGRGRDYLRVDARDDWDHPSCER